MRGTNGWEVYTGGFPRGIAFSDKNIFLGVSEFTERKYRDFTDGKIFVYNKNWILEREIILKKEGLVLDLFLIF